MHPPSIRRACISYQEFTGNAHHGGKERRYTTGCGPMDVWQERGTGRGFEMERHGDWTVLTGMKG